MQDSEAIVSARVDADTKHRLKVAAAIEDKTISDYVAELIRNDLDEKDLPV